MSDGAHIFSIIFQIAGAVEPDAYAERAYESEQLADVLIGGPDAAGIFEADVEREGGTFPEAVLDAIRDVERVFPEAAVLRVAPDDLVTIAAIAQRTARSHESVRLLALGRRGPGRFPPPIGHLDAKTQVWRWSEVARWFDARDMPVPGGEHAAFLAAVNDVLHLRRVAVGSLDARVATGLAALLPEGPGWPRRRRAA